MERRTIVSILFSAILAALGLYVFFYQIVTATNSNCNESALTTEFTYAQNRARKLEERVTQLQSAISELNEIILNSKKDCSVNLTRVEEINNRIKEKPDGGGGVGDSDDDHNDEQKDRTEKKIPFPWKEYQVVTKNHRLTMDDLVFITTTDQSVEYRAEGQVNGWASTVKHLIIASDKDDPELGAINVFRNPSTGEDDLDRVKANVQKYFDKYGRGRDKQWMLSQYKPVYALRHAWALYPDKEWYVFVDDDTFVNTHVLLHVLATEFGGQSRSHKLCIGDIWPTPVSSAWAQDKKSYDEWFKYPVGGAGYVVSHKLMKALANEADKWIGYMFENTWHSDTIMGRAMTEIPGTKFKTVKGFYQCNKDPNSEFYSSYAPLVPYPITLHSLKKKEDQIQYYLDYYVNLS